jgi:hypothetical protein
VSTNDQLKWWRRLGPDFDEGHGSSRTTSLERFSIPLLTADFLEGTCFNAATVFIYCAYYYITEIWKI